MLYEIFDCRVSRLPSMEELKEQIQKNWVLLYRENGEIIAFLMYQMDGGKNIMDIRISQLRDSRYYL